VDRVLLNCRFSLRCAAVEMTKGGCFRADDFPVASATCYLLGSGPPLNNSKPELSIGKVSLESTRWFARSIAPRKHFCVLPTRTRPNLFGGD